LNVLAGGDIFFVRVVGFSLGDSFGLRQFIGLELRDRYFFWIGRGDLFSKEGCAGFFVHDVENDREYN
jgi:hypothetical protein